MTAGDAAAAIGFPIVAGTAPIRTVTRINTSRDLLAEDITSGTRSTAQITSGIFATSRLPRDRGQQGWHRRDQRGTSEN